MSAASSPHLLRAYETVLPAAGAIDGDAGGTTRRDFLKLLSAGLALGTAACSGPPVETILPYVDAPETLVPGVPLYYASAYVKQGYAHGVLIESNMGRPTKVEGNPLHPASLGATDAQTQGAALEFWDPDRSQTVYQGAVTSTWPELRTALDAALQQTVRQRGRGLRVLTGSITSPTLVAQLRALLQRYPEARWHTYQPLHDDAAVRGATLAFGRPLDAVYRLDRVRTLVSLDARLFSRLPGSVRYARDYIAARRAGLEATPVRFYAAEACPSLDGAIADDRLALSPSGIETLVWGIAAALGLTPASQPADDAMQRRQRAIAAALRRSRGASLLVAGPALAPATHTLVHAMNAHLGNVGATVDYIEPVAAQPAAGVGDLRELAADMHAGRVALLVVLGGNPVYDAPADVDFDAALRRVPLSLHHALYRNETSRRCTWHAPLAHGFETWSDARAYDGTASLVQPVARPLYAGRSWHELLAWLAGDGERAAYDLVRTHWQAGHGGENFADFWRMALRNGVVAASASRPVAVQARLPSAPPSSSRQPLHLLLTEDASAGNGEYANNAWLQELPRPLTKLTWDNALLVGAATAGRLNVKTGDVVKLAKGPRSVEAPVWLMPGLAEDVLVLPVGYGRWAAGRVGDGVGCNAYALLTADDEAPSVAPTGRQHVFATTQHHGDMEGRDLVRHARWDDYRRNTRFAADEPRERVPEASLYPDHAYESYRWGMAIDLNACIGCNACTIACQAENNIPVVGKREVIRGREMHWIRIDRYYEGPRSAPRVHFQPVPCMHCENAPCEEVCPVGATVHDSEGLNVQVYNRCIGTRFCSNNCPYKVRRFNFLQYSNTGIESLKAVQNPEVTVRRRGVMEKCTYCVQRITRGRIAAEKEERRLRDGEVVTACQAVCPTQAIVFGDLGDPGSAVSRARASPLNYALLAELNTRPRTTYLARVLNPDADL